MCRRNDIASYAFTSCKSSDVILPAEGGKGGRERKGKFLG